MNKRKQNQPQPQPLHSAALPLANSTANSTAMKSIGSLSNRFGFKGQPKEGANKENLPANTNSNTNSNTAAEQPKAESAAAASASAEFNSLLTAPTPKKSRIVAQPPLSTAQLSDERERFTAEIQSELVARPGILSAAGEIFSADLESETKRALAAKVTAAKLNFKDQIGQLTANVKLLKKSISSELTGRQELLKRANSIEVSYQLEIREKSLRSWDLQQVINSLHAKLTGEERKLSAIELERQKLLSQIRENSTEQEKLDIVIGQTQVEKQNLLAQLAELKCLNDEYLAEIENLQNSKESLNRVLTEIQAEKSEISGRINKLTAEREELNEIIQKQEEEIVAQQEKINSQRELNGELMANYEGALNEIKEIRALEEANSALLTAANEKARQLQGFYSEAEEKLKAAGESILTLNAAAEARNAQFDKEMKAREEKSNSEITELKAKKDEEIHAIIMELADSRALNEQLKQQKAHWESQHQTASLALAELRGAELGLIQRASQLTNELAKVQAEFGLVKVQLESKASELTSAISSFTKANEFHQEIHSKLRAEKEKLEFRGQELELEKLSLTSALSDSRAANEKANAELKLANSEICSLRELKSAVEEELANEKFSAAKKSEEFKAENNKINEEVKKSKAINDETVKELGEFKVRFHQTHAELESFKKHAGVSSEAQLTELVKLSVEAEEMRTALSGKSELMRDLEETRAKLKFAVGKLAAAEQTRREMHNQLQELKGNIRVYTRIRPNNDQDGADEKLSGSAIDLSADSRKMKLTADQTKAPQLFQFDHIFTPAANQVEVFEEIAPLIQSALDGYQVCLFSYGQTGSGKTHTMSGGNTSDSRGIIPRSIEKMLAAIEDMSLQGWSYVVECSFIEIYNESIRDLLNSKPDEGIKYEIKRDSTTGSTIVTGAVRLPVKKLSEINEIMRTANKNRSVAATKMNDQSSRSHSIFTITINGTNATNKQSISGSLSLCDLAGSERLSRSQAEGARLKETQAINKSLSALTDVFTSIGKKSSHIPFRNSLLTYFLQPCLSGDGKTIMICNVSQTQESAFETLCSLRFAQQVNQCELGRPKKSIKAEK